MPLPESLPEASLEASLEALAATVAALERRLAAVEDAHAIQNLKSRYGQLADSRYSRGRSEESGRDASGPVAQPALDRIAREIATLFTEDAIWDGGSGLGVCRGREEIYARFRAPTLRFSWHYFVKPEIHVDGDRARATWDVLAPCTSRDGRALWMAGTEADEYVKQHGAWLHSAMRLRVVFMAPHDRGWAADRSE
jgi:hypothetical protein